MTGLSQHTALIAAASISAALLAACDRSPQNADGATKEGDPGVAANGQTVPGAGLADTGRDTGTGGNIGGAGELGAGSGSPVAGAAGAAGGAAAGGAGATT